MPASNISTSLNKLINYVYVSPDKTDEWKSKGFKEDKLFALGLWDEPGEYVVMTHEPISIIEFGFKLKMQNDFIWLVLCICNAEGYMMLDGRVFCAANQYKKNYNPWYSSLNNLINHLKKSFKIQDHNLIVSDESMTFVLEKEGVNRQVNILKNDKSLSPMGSGIERIDAFNVGCMSDYMMVIFDNTNLFVD